MKPHLPWKCLDLECPASLREEIEAILFLNGCQGTEEAVLSPASETHCAAPVKLRAYFPPDIDTAEVRACVEAAGPCGLFETTVADRDWEQEWRKNLAPVKIARHFWVRPSWLEFQPPDGDQVLIIDPKMTFGSGHHETTRLAASWLEEIGRGAQRVLDVGCGTGILALVAARLGCHTVIAFDIDPMMADNGPENFKRNVPAGRVRAFVGTAESLRPKPRFDLIVANMIRNEIFPLLDALCSLTRPGGRLIFSGFLASERDLISERLRTTPLELLGERTESEWLSICCRKKGSGSYSRPHPVLAP